MKKFFFLLSLSSDDFFKNQQSLAIQIQKAKTAKKKIAKAKVNQQ